MSEYLLTGLNTSGRMIGFLA